jgi:SNF2 family DNA or RNA helicase
VIWATFTHDIDAIAREFDKEGILSIQGSTSMDDRLEAIRAFQEDEGRRLIVLQTQCGSQGITLHAAHLSVFYSQDYNLGNKMQAQDRLHRIGQKNPVTYIDLICSGSIEQDIIESLDEKKLMAGYVQGDIQDLILARFKQRSTRREK